MEGRRGGESVDVEGRRCGGLALKVGARVTGVAGSGFVASDGGE